MSKPSSGLLPGIDLGLQTKKPIIALMYEDDGEYQTTMPMERRLVFEPNFCWQEEKSVPEKRNDMVGVFLQESIAPDYDWGKVMPPTVFKKGKHHVKKGWVFEPKYFTIWVYNFRDYWLLTEWSFIESAAYDLGYEIALVKRENEDRCFISLGTTPRSANNPHAFPMGVRFCEFLATTNVPPHVVIQILYCQLGHKYVPIGCQPGGLCLKHGIPQGTFVHRYKRFIPFAEDILDAVGSGISLYLTGNTISVVGKREQESELDMVVEYAERCILENEEPATALNSFKAAILKMRQPSSQEEEKEEED